MSWIEKHPLFVTTQEGQIFYKGKELSNEDKETLQDQAETFSKSFLWAYIKNELRIHGLNGLLENAEKDKDGSYGKALLNTEALITNLLNSLSK